MHCSGFMALVTWVKFLGEKLKVTIPLMTHLRFTWDEAIHLCKMSLLNDWLIDSWLWGHSFVWESFLNHISRTGTCLITLCRRPSSKPGDTKTRDSFYSDWAPSWGCRWCDLRVQFEELYFILLLFFDYKWEHCHPATISAHTGR